MKRQIEIPVNNNYIATSRSLDVNHPNNRNLYESSQEFLDLLKEVKIRFDTNPKFYQKEDYQKLIELIRKKGGSGGDININITSEGNVVTNITAEGNTLNVTKGQSRYPRARWARRGFIDITNCKDIDYIIVPCTSKQQCLYVTNDYLKSLRHVETYMSMYGEEVDIDNLSEDFWKKVSQYFDNYDIKEHIYNQPRIISNLDINKLPASTIDQHFINCKEFAKVRVNTFEDYSNIHNPLKLLFYRKDAQNGFIQFPYLKYENEYDDQFLINTNFIFTPYMVFANPFNSTLGGVIPVKDGKLLIEKATILKNKTLELVSTGQLIRFDEYGICDTQFNPETYIYTTMKACRGLRGRSTPGKYGKSADRKVIIRNKVISPRQGSSNRRHCIRKRGGMVSTLRGTTYLHSRMVLKWKKQFPRYISKKEYKELNGVYKTISFIDGTSKEIYLKSEKKRQYDRVFEHNPADGYVTFDLNRYQKTNGDEPSYTCEIHKRYKAPYDRMNMYTINKYAHIIRECDSNIHHYINEYPEEK